MPINFVAEVASNHHSDLSKCLRFIEKASEIGCQTVKFQLFKLEELFSPEILAHSKRHLERKAWELPKSFLPEIRSACDALGLRFSCTPFYLDAVQELFPHVEEYKIASYELLWDDLIASCAKTGKPVVLATGMANKKEVAHAISVARKNGCVDLTVLHCVSLYPTPIETCNLAVIESLRKEFEVKVGWSDHTHSPAAIYQASLGMKSDMIEFHLDLDGKGQDNFGHCWLPEEMKELISNVNLAEKAFGSRQKQPHAEESIERIWRADPKDGLRPLRSTREGFLAEQTS